MLVYILVLVVAYSLLFIVCRVHDQTASNTIKHWTTTLTVAIWLVVGTATAHFLNGVQVW